MRLRERRRLRRGQAMLEYSVLNWVLVVALVLGSTVRLIPGPPGAGPQNLFDLFLNAYRIYYQSFSYVLNLPFP